MIEINVGYTSVMYIPSMAQTVPIGIVRIKFYINWLNLVLSDKSRIMFKASNLINVFQRMFCYKWSRKYLPGRCYDLYHKNKEILSRFLMKKVTLTLQRIMLWRRINDCKGEDGSCRPRCYGTYSWGYFHGNDGGDPTESLWMNHDSSPSSEIERKFKITWTSLYE